MNKTSFHNGIRFKITPLSVFEYRYDKEIKVLNEYMNDSNTPRRQIHMEWAGDTGFMIHLIGLRKVEKEFILYSTLITSNTYAESSIRR